MTSSASIPRQLLIFIVIVPLALLMGYLIATPDDLLAILGVSLVVGVLSLPILLKSHHTLLVFSLNAALIVAFLPGSPNVWMLMMFVSGGLTLLGRIMDKNRRLLWVPSVAWPLILLGAVVLVTSKITGGFGLRALGSGAYGGKKYFFVWGAILVFFAVSWVRIPVQRALGIMNGYLLSGLSSVLSNLVYMAGPAAWILYNFIPWDIAMHQIYEDYDGGPGGEQFTRLGGLTAAAHTLVPFLMMHLGVRGMLDYRTPWKMGALMAVIFMGALGGFRSYIVFVVLLFAVQFIAEGLMRTRLLPMVLLATALGFAALIPLASRMPLSIQRALSVLPLPVSQAARFDAEQSNAWRQYLWTMVLPDIPKYLWVGKGFTASATDYYLTLQMVRRGMRTDQELMILSGDYHNGPLSVLLPFGVWGVLTFGWFAWSSIRLLYRNFRYGDPKLQKINTFLLSFFIAKLLYFCLIFGAIHLDLLWFVSIVALSICINGGLRRREDLQEAARAASATDTKAGSASEQPA